MQRPCFGMAGCDIRSVGPYVLEGTLGRGQTGMEQHSQSFDPSIFQAQF